MIRRFITSVIFFTLCILGVQQTASAQDFEGVIHYEIPDMTQQGMGQIPYMIKNSNVRMEFATGQQKGALLLLPDESKMVVIIEAMQGYMTMNMKKITNEDDYANTEVTKTSQTKTIGGHQCIVWKIDSPDKSVEACMAKGLGNFVMPRSPMVQQQTPAWAKKLMNNGGMPLEVIELKNGHEKMQMRATKIERKSLSSDLFKIPKGYRDMSGMMQQFQNRN
jgi:hypothetical protein